MTMNSLLHISTILALFFGQSTAQGCDVSGSDGSYTETIVDDTTRNVVSTGCPMNDIEDICNVDLSSQRGVRIAADKDIDIPAYPVICDTADRGALLSYGMGITFDGISIYAGGNCAVNLTEYDPDLCFDPLIEETFDCCNGHPDATGQYHYHSTPHCLLDSIGDRVRNNRHSKQVGWSFDGFPMYGPYGTGFNQLIYPCTHPSADPNDCLDECNGHSHHEIDGFTYHYHFAGSNGTDPADISQRPYSIGCFVGKPNWDSITGRNGNDIDYIDERICNESGVISEYQPMAHQGIRTQLVKRLLNL